jgi:hypothetical protein
VVGHLQRAGEVGRERRGDVDRGTREGMSEGETRRMEELPRKPQVSRDAVDRVTGDGKVDGGEMDADLVRPAGLEPDAEERVGRQEFLELEVRDGPAGRVRVERVAQAIVPVTADWGVDRPAPRPRPAGDEREILPRQRPTAYKPLQPLVGLLRARHDEQPRRVAVETVDDAGAILLPALCAGRGESLRERASGVSGGGMDHHAGGLVDDQEVLVRIRDGELGRRGGRLRRSRYRRLDLDLLSARELVALAAGPPLYEYRTRVEQALGRGAGSDLRQPSEVSVEPLAGGVRRDDEALQRLGSRSAQTRAASRIPTPITMKLSARLNAGQ